VKSSNEKEIQRLENESQQQEDLFEQEKEKGGLSTQLISNLELPLADKMEIVNVYQTLVESKNNEIKDMKIEKEVLELKRRLDEHERRSQPLVDGSDSTNDNNNSTNNTNSTVETDDQTPLSKTPNRNRYNFREKIKVEPENNSSSVRQIWNKKRKVTSTDS
jgi:hypothetical protein